MTEPVRAGSGWLALRERADAEARSTDLVGLLRPRLPAGEKVVHDLGSGTGSMVRWLAPRLTGPQRWVLHDRDAELLGHAASAPPPSSEDGSPVTVETRLDDITRLDPAEVAGASLVTGSALLDMFTASDLERFVAVCAGAGCPVLLTLSVVGRADLVPADPLDRALVDAFNAHQRRPTADGRLLGPGAAEAAAAALEQRGLEVVRRPSPWRLGAGQSALAAEWLTGWVAAAREQEPELAEVAAYASRRRAGILDGSVSVTVHHLDLLALPRGR